MDINTNTMTKVHDVNENKATTPDLKYSEQTERWTMNEIVQDALNLDDSRGLDMYVAEDENTKEQVPVLEIVDANDATFFTGAGNVFIARRLAKAIDHHSFVLTPIDNMDGEFYALNEWEGESKVLDTDDLFNSSNDEKEEETMEIEEEVTDLGTDESNNEVEFDYSMDDEEDTLPA